MDGIVRLFLALVIALLAPLGGAGASSSRGLGGRSPASLFQLPDADFAAAGFHF
jgi:hypothetical protein